jgi:hypothetical protein
MSNTSIFEIITGKVQSRDLTKKQKAEFVKNVGSFSHEEISILYALITIYKIQYEGDLNQLVDADSHKHPYNGQSDGSSGVVFDIDEFPIKLKHAIYKFMNIVVTKNTEELQLWTNAIRKIQ